MKYGERLRLAREHAGLTQQELAEKTGNVTSQMNVSKLERGDATGSQFTAQFADACGVRAMWLAEEQGDMVDGLYVDDPQLKAALSRPELVAALRLMEPLPRYAVNHVVKDIAETQELINQAAESKDSAA